MKQSSNTVWALGISSLVMTAVLTGCGSDSGNGVSEPQPSAFQGVWERQGYGDIYTVNDSGGKVYQYTQSGCLQVEDADNADMAVFFKDATLSGDGNALTLGEDVGGAFPVVLDRRAELPVVCGQDQLIRTATPSVTFEHFAQTYSDYYAFFSERGVDWASRVADARLQVSDDLSDEALFEILAGLLEPLNDGHVQLEADGEVYRPAKDRGANAIIEQAFALQSDYTDIQSFANDVSLQYWENIGDYLDEGSVEAFDGALPDRMIWGTMGGGTVGYLYISSMAFFDSAEGGLNQQANVAAVQALMSQVMADLANTQGLIIDIRKNIGGHDAVSKVIASHFTAQEILFGSKFARSYMGETAIVNSYMQAASPTPYLNPVALIAGVETASAAESFTSAMKSLPQVTVVGENTQGILSDVLEKELPNGWEIWLANEVYIGPQGGRYEVSGIAPDIAAPVFSLQAVEQGNNAAIDAALTAIGF